VRVAVIITCWELGQSRQLKVNESDVFQLLTGRIRGATPLIKSVLGMKHASWALLITRDWLADY
jgi:hypothetical protein